MNDCHCDLVGLTIGHTRVAVDLGFEFNNFNREAIKYSQSRIGLSLGLM